MGGFVLAWLVGQGIIAYRSYRVQGGPPWPGQMLWASGAYAILALVSEGGPAAHRLAATVAWGLNAAAFLNLFPTPPSPAGKTWWDKIPAQPATQILPGNCAAAAAAPAQATGTAGFPKQSSSTIKNVTGTGTGQTTVPGAVATGTIPGTSLGNPAAGGGATY